MLAHGDTEIAADQDGSMTANVEWKELKKAFARDELVRAGAHRWLLAVGGWLRQEHQDPT